MVHNHKMINVISRRDIDHLYEHHVLHSLAIAKFINFNNDAEIMDVGTGGGFPGIPLAILFPYTQFTLVDSVGKKIKVVQAIVDSLQLQNVKAVNCRAEKAEGVDEQFDFIISRATSSLSEIVKWTEGKLKKKNTHVILNGFICLKGGGLSEDIKLFKKNMQVFPISNYFSETFFESKKIVYLPN